VTYAERVVLDVIYVGAWSLPRDVAIMTRTIPAVVRARGTS
jgi:exopolysaccharide production protein ExoY